jgi:hypothetical protein
MRTSRFVAALIPLLVGCGALVGCGDDGSPTPGTSTPTASTPAARPGAPAPSSTGSAPAGSAPATATYLVEYARQGGLAGVDDRLSVRPNGAYEITRGGAAPRRGSLPAPELAELSAVLRSANFADIPAVNSGGDIVDGYTHQVVYGQHAVLAEDGGVPDALRPVLGALDGIITRHG